MSFPCAMSLMRRVCFLSVLALIAPALASAQSSPSPSLIAANSGDSSSAAINPAADPAALPSAPSPQGARERNYGARKNSLFNHLTFAAGGGFNAPASDSSPYITWGGNFTAAGGYRFNPWVSLMAEYQFIGDKLPGALIAETGANGGNAHIWSLTMSPIVDLLPRRANSIYLTGGGGFYRKVTNFTNPEPTLYCDYFYCGVVYANQVVGHFSSNQGGWNIGGGYTHRLGGLNGDGKARLFAEVRYLDVMTPAVTTQPNGLGTTTVAAGTRLIPVTLGIRW